MFPRRGGGYELQSSGFWTTSFKVNSGVSSSTSTSSSKKPPIVLVEPEALVYQTDAAVRKPAPAAVDAVAIANQR